MLLRYLVLLTILLAGMLLSIRLKKLTPAGAFTGGLIGFCVFLGADFIGLGMMSLFFALGVLATSWKIKTKESLGVAEREKGKRTAAQVAANAGLPAILGLAVYIFPHHQVLFRVLLAACFSSATADTLSSELGTVYGRRFYNVLTLKKDKRGDNGVISLEGSLFGLAGSSLIALVYALGFGWDIFFLWIVIAGTAGNFADSVLGATLERKQFLKNDAVNFLNTVVAALTATVLFLIS